MSTESEGPEARDEQPERPQRSQRGSDRPARDAGRPQRGGAPRRRTPDATGRPKRQGRRPTGDRPDRTDRSSGGDRPFRGERPAREGGAARGERPFRGERPVRGERSGRDGAPQRRDSRPARDGAPARRGGPRDEQRLWTREGKPARGDRSASQRELPEDPDPFNTRSVRERHDDPPLPDDITPDSLDRIARNELKTLTAENQEFVARHLAMAARTIDDDPELAHQHATSAARRGGRIGVVRETLAITAYTTGDFALALRELRTYRRITGRDEHLPLMVDCERGLGRPERALELGRSVPRASLPTAVQASLAIAMSGARLDLGQTELALAELEIPQLDPNTAYSFSPALFDAYATVLEDLGRTEEAAQWFRRADLASAALHHGDDDGFLEVFEEELAAAEQESAEHESAGTGEEQADEDAVAAPSDEQPSDD